MKTENDAWRNLLAIILDLPETADDDTLNDAAEVAQAKLETTQTPANATLPSDSVWKAALTKLLGIGGDASMAEIKEVAAQAVMTLHGIKLLSTDERAVCRQLGMSERSFVLNTAAPQSPLPPEEDKVRRQLGISLETWGAA